MDRELVCDRVRSFLNRVSASVARSFSCLGFRLHPRCEPRVGISASSIYGPGAPPPDEGLDLCGVEFCVVVELCVVDEVAWASVVRRSGRGAREKKRAMAVESEEAIVVQLDAEDLSKGENLSDLSKMEDLWAKLPDEVQQKIFKPLRWRQLFRVCVVCKSFNEGINRYVRDLPLFRTAVPIPSR